MPQARFLIDAGKLGHLGYGTSKNIVTREQLEELVASGKINKPSDGKPAGSVVFILCAGSRDKNHLPYCLFYLLYGIA